MPTSINGVFKLFVPTALVVLLSIFVIDCPLELAIVRFIARYNLTKPTGSIPDLLFFISGAVTIAAWIAYAGFSSTRLHNAALKVIGFSVPAALVVKEIFQHAFGRISSRVWMLNPAVPQFHLLHGHGDYCNFPSGHMAVFCALFLGLCRLTPSSKWRYAWIGLSALLGVALLITGYHFLSDIVAGAYVGFASDRLTNYAVNAGARAKVCPDKCSVK